MSFKKITSALLIIIFLFVYLINPIITKKAQASHPAHVGKWSPVTQWPVRATHTTLLPNGKVMTWPSFEGGGSPYIWDPATNAIVEGPKIGYNAFCAGHTLTADGKLFSAGGHITDVNGLPYASFYDSTNNTWTRVKNMNDARWYPTTTTLANGNILVTSGTIAKGEGRNKIPQVYIIRKNKWRTLSSAKLRTSLYPFMYTTSNGKVFMAGNNSATRYLKTSGTGSWGKVIKTKHGGRGAGTSVMYANGKILIIGGGNKDKGNTRSVEKINLNASTPKWTYAAPMSGKRKQANATLLPDGRVLVTGGTSSNLPGPEGFDDATKPVKFAEVWNPKTNKWKRLASNTVYRGYHSTALLLPDGRVLSAGGEKSDTTMEIFSPPYLFKGTRPKIKWAPKQVNYGQTFTINTPNLWSIDKVRWVRLGSVTHSFNQSQRINTLSFVKKDGKIRAKVPSNQGKTPPGHYMLFILNKKGVPSVAKIVKVGNINISLPPSLPDPPPPEGPFDPANHEEFELDE